MEKSGKNRRHSAEFRIEIAQRMLAGESVMALSRRFGLARSMMYRWRAAYREKGVPGLSRPVGRSPGASAVAQAPSGGLGGLGGLGTFMIGICQGEKEIPLPGLDPYPETGRLGTGWPGPLP
jgi:hypothetical protein